MCWSWIVQYSSRYHAFFIHRPLGILYTRISIWMFYNNYHRCWESNCPTGSHTCFRLRPRCLVYLSPFYNQHQWYESRDSNSVMYLWCQWTVIAQMAHVVAILARQASPFAVCPGKDTFITARLCLFLIWTLESSNFYSIECKCVANRLRS